MSVSTKSSPLTPEQRSVAVLLRLFGILDLFALLAVLAPREELYYVAKSAGLLLPLEPLPVYLARSASALYALHGALVVFLSLDIVHYWRVVRFLALAALVHGGIVLGIDIAEGMPWWWVCFEGPAIAATGAIILVLQWQADRKAVTGLSSGKSAKA